MQRNPPYKVSGLELTRYLLTFSFMAPASSTTTTSGGKGAQGAMRSLIENPGFSHNVHFIPLHSFLQMVSVELGHLFKPGWRTGSEAGN